MTEAAEKITADDIRKALESKYAAPEWYLGFEVGNSTGANCRRHADAVAINAYPSKGHEIRGFEIKVSKSDLQTELENGIKSDEIARYCDYWFLATPKGLTKGFALPPTWGVVEYNDGRLLQVINPQKLERAQPPVGFIAAMLRGRERLVANQSQKINAEERRRIEEQVLWRVKNSEKELEKLREKLAEIKQKTGIELDDWEPTRTIVARLKAAEALEVIDQNMRWIESAAKTIGEGSVALQKALKTIRNLEQDAQ
jgi:hypothetical protein